MIVPLSPHAALAYLRSRLERETRPGSIAYIQRAIAATEDRIRRERICIVPGQDRATEEPA